MGSEIALTRKLQLGMNSDERAAPLELFKTPANNLVRTPVQGLPWAWDGPEGMSFLVDQGWSASFVT